MLRKKQVLFVLVFILSVVVYTVNHSFSSVKKTYDTEKPKLDLIENEFKPEAKAKAVLDYKSILYDELISFNSKLEYKAKTNRFHGVVLVAYKNQVIFEEAYGYKNPTTKEKLSTDVSFELASVSKQFTAASVLKLSELGQVNLDKTLNNYFPKFKFDNISIRDLLKHSSGLWDYMNLTEAYWDKPKAPNNEQIINLINDHQTALSFTPGSRFDYNNTNYALLVALVEKVSGISYDEFLQQNFFKPFCMDNTYVGVQSRVRENVVNAYQPYARGYIKLPPSFHNSALGDKGIHATANNLWLWFKALKNNESLSENSIKKMFNLDTYKNYNYGMGFRTKASPNGELEIYHDGLWDGFRDGLHYFPEEDLTYIVLSHTQNKEKRYFQNYVEKHAKTMLKTITTDKTLIAETL